MVYSILEMMGRVIMETFASPFFISLYLFLLIIIGWQYRRLQKTYETLFNIKRNIFLRLVLTSAVFGLLGGVLGSILLIFLGVDLGRIAVVYLWLVAMILMFIHPRFLCFAYSAGVISVTNLLFGYPELSIPQLMSLVAVLHIVESVLILLSGHLNPIPIYIQKNKDLVGGFNLQKFWPIPLVAMVSVGMVTGPDNIIMPDWWPLIIDSDFTGNTTYLMLPVLAVLGYGEISTTRIPAEKTNKSALHLLVFSLVLLLVAVLSSRFDNLLLLTALFAPFGHELVIWLGLREENKRAPIYTASSRGIMVLDIIPGSPAAKAGLKSQDIILEVNGEPVNNREPDELLNNCRRTTYLKITRQEKIINIKYFCCTNENAGIIPVPDQDTMKFLYYNENRIFKKLCSLFRP